MALLRVLDAARSVIDEVNRLIDRRTPRLIYREQLRESAQSVAANIQEAFGRTRGPDRRVFLGYARASAEEANEHLRSNFGSRRLRPVDYWPLHHRLVTIARMLDALIEDD